MRTVHLVMQGKGGVGKSLVAALIAQYGQHTGTDMLCLDLDPVNRTFTGYASLNVTHIDIMNGDEISIRRFDTLVEHIAGSTGDVVVDNGASSFVPLSHYLVSNEIPAFLAETDSHLLLHVILTGGQALPDTVNGFVQMAGQFPDTCRFFVWLNPYWGPVEADGKPFESMRAFRDFESRIAAVIALPQMKSETYGRDFSGMLLQRRTFKEALADSTLSLMERQRLKILRDRIFSTLSRSPLHAAFSS